MADVRRGSVTLDDVEISYLEAGEGPLVLLCHGFPESSYSYRRQLTFLAEHGYRAVAPDMRGYGQSSAPREVERYSILALTGDMVGLLDHLKEDTAVIVGHDWGAPIAWHCALFRPDLFRGVVGLSVPFQPRRRGTPPTPVFRRLSEAHGDGEFYMLYFQRPGEAEAELEADIDFTVRAFLYAAPTDGGSSGWMQIFTSNGRLLGGVTIPDTLPAWLEERDVQHYIGEFERGGFRGPLNFYRNLDRNWELTAAFEGMKIVVPSMFITGSRDLVRKFSKSGEEHLADHLADLRGVHVIEGKGHWIQQEASEEVNRLLLDFLHSLDPPKSR